MVKHLKQTDTSKSDNEQVYHRADQILDKNVLMYYECLCDGLIPPCLNLLEFVYSQIFISCPGDPVKCIFWVPYTQPLVRVSVTDFILSL